MNTKIYNLTILDTLGDISVDIQTEFGGQWWSEGNGSCDCNRLIYILGSETINSNISCLGCNRFLIIKSDIPDYTLLQLNQDYPKKLLEENNI